LATATNPVGSLLPGEEDGNNNNNNDDDKDNNNDNEDDSTAPAVVYESPFGSMVTRLRTVTLLTAVAGTLGLPAVVLFKGTVPTAGFLALCASFATTSLSTTAAIHYVFSPYVFSIERILL
jgi:hypothetical protein